jgi:type I restriction enzyme S subunit
MQKIELKKQFKPYTEYKDSRVEWIGKIPKDWKNRRIKFVTKITNGATPASDVPEFWDGQINWVTPDDLSKSESLYLSETRRKITEVGYKSCGTSLISAGNIILSTRAPIGLLAINKTNVCTNQGCKGLTVNKECIVKYFYYQIKSLVPALDAFGTGTTFKELSRQKLANFIILLPTKDEQKKISNYLDTKTAIIDKIIEQKQKLIELLKEKRTAVINKAVTCGLDENVELVDSGADWVGKVPKGWRVEKLKFVVRINRNTLSETTKSNYNLKYIDIGNVDINGVKDEPEELNFTNAPSRARRIVKKENTIVGTVRTYLKALAYFDNPESNLVVSTGFAVLEPTKSLLGKYIYYFVCSEKFIQNVSKWSTGVSYPAINPTTLGCLPVCIPPIGEQQKIIKYLDVQISGIEIAGEKIKKSIELLKEYKSSLIYNVVTGKVKV